MLSVVALHLSPYAGRPSPGVSFDTPYYVWRTNLAATDGLQPLTELPPGVTANPDRPAFPAVGAIVGSVTGLDGFSFAIAVRGVAAVAIGLAAGALAIGPMAQPSWAGLVLVIALGASAAVAGTAIGSLDNLLVDAPLVALATLVPLALHGERSVGGLILLTAGSALIHWVFTGLFIVLVLATAGIAAFARRRRSGRPTSRTALRTVAATLAGVALAAAFAPALPDGLPGTTGTRGNELRLGLYHLPVLLPIAVGSAVLHALRARDGTMRTATFLLALWAGSVPVAFAVSAILPTPLKLFRIAAFAVAIPILAVLGGVALADLVRHRYGRVGAVAGGVLVLVVVFLGLPSVVGPLSERGSARLIARLEQARVLGQYLETIHPRPRAVIVVVRGHAKTFDRVLRSAVPADLIPTTHVYVGDVEDLYAGRPTIDADRPRLSAASTEWWRASWSDPDAVLALDPVVAAIVPHDRAGRDVASLGSGVRLLRGPPTEVRPTPIAPIRLGWATMLTSSLVALLVLGAVGAGWSRSLGGVDVGVALALAPAFGIAVLAIAGVAVARGGWPLGGWLGVTIVVVATAVGWVPFLVRRMRPGSATT